MGSGWHVSRGGEGILVLIFPAPFCNFGQWVCENAIKNGMPSLARPGGCGRGRGRGRLPGMESGEVPRLER